MKTIKKIIKKLVSIAIQSFAFAKRLFKPRKKMHKDLRKAKSNDIDMANVMNSINGSRELYKELSRKYHPDRFLDPEKNKLASEIMKDITDNKRDFNKLQELKQRAENELY